MDNQQSPKLLAKADEPVFDQTLAEVAAETGAALFSRRALMRGWRREGAPLTEFIAADGLHHNDRGYLCVAEALAQEILAGLAPGQPMTAALSRKFAPHDRGAVNQCTQLSEGAFARHVLHAAVGGRDQPLRGDMPQPGTDACRRPVRPSRRPRCQGPARPA